MRGYLSRVCPDLVPLIAVSCFVGIVIKVLQVGPSLVDQAQLYAFPALAVVLIALYVVFLVVRTALMDLGLWRSGRR